MSNDVLDIDAVEAAREEALAARKRYEAELDAGYLWIMESYNGRRVIWDLVAPLWRSSYTGDRMDTDFREGERNVALRIWAQLIRLCPVLARKMHEENAK